MNPQKKSKSKTLNHNIFANHSGAQYKSFKTGQLQQIKSSMVGSINKHMFLKNKKKDMAHDTKKSWKLKVQRFSFIISKKHFNSMHWKQYHPMQKAVWSYWWTGRRENSIPAWWKAIVTVTYAAGLLGRGCATTRASSPCRCAGHHPTGSGWCVSLAGKSLRGHSSSGTRAGVLRLEGSTGTPGRATEVRLGWKQVVLKAWQNKDYVLQWVTTV